jgi:branched-chain amino acid transport system permease protein
MTLRSLRSWRIIPLAVLVVAFVGFPFIAPGFQVAFVNSALIAALGAMGLNIVMGLAGLVTAGNAALLAVGSYASAALTTTLGLPFPLVLLLSVIAGAVIGVIIGLPSLRVQGIYLAIATLALHFVVIYFFNLYQANAVGATGFFMPVANLAGWSIVGNSSWYLVLTIVAVLVYLGSESLKRSRYGRAWMLLRDAPLVAASQGVWLAKYKIVAFVLSSAIIAGSGSLLAYFQGSVYIDSYSLDVAIQYIAMIIIGGVGSTGGAVAGAFFVTLVPTIISRLVAGLPSESPITAFFSQNSGDVQLVIYGALVIVFLMFQPKGLAGLAARLGRAIDTALARRRPASPVREERS